MRDTLTFFTAMFALTALTEFGVLWRWYGRKSIRTCIVGVAAFSGVVWMMCCTTLSWLQWGWKASTEPPISGSEWVPIGLLILFDVLLLSAVALIPAGLVALVYCRVRSKA